MKMQSAFRMFARTSIQKRHFANLKGSFYGFECSSYMNRDYDLTLLEKSIRYGCRTMVEKSVAKDSSRTYELITDLAASEEYNIQDFFLVHVLKDRLQIKKNDMTIDQEISGIQKILRGKAIDVISLSIPSFLLINTQSEKNDTSELVNVGNYFNDYFSQISYLCSKFTSLGVDLSTEWLDQASHEDIALLLNAIDNFNTIHSNDEAIIVENSRVGAEGGSGKKIALDPIHGTHRVLTNNMKKIEYLSIATNALTFQSLNEIQSWAAEKGIQTIATEVLRTHSNRPGLLSITGGRHKGFNFDPANVEGLIFGGQIDVPSDVPSGEAPRVDNSDTSAIDDDNSEIDRLSLINRSKKHSDDDGSLKKGPDNTYNSSIKSTNTNVNKVTRPGGIGANNGITTDGLSEYTPDPRIPKKAEEVVSTDVSNVRSMKAIDDLNRSMNACMHAENQYLTKLHKEGSEIDKQSVCWGHILSQKQDLILYPEEWDYFYTNQVLPQMNKSIEILKAKDGESKDWTLLYTPLVKSLFSHFAIVLEIRRVHLCNDVLTHFHNEIKDLNHVQNTTYKKNDIRDLPQFLGVLASSCVSKHVVLSNTEVYADNWIANKESNKALLTEKKEKIFSKIENSLRVYSTEK